MGESLLKDTCAERGGEGRVEREDIISFVQLHYRASFETNVG